MRLVRYTSFFGVTFTIGVGHGLWRLWPKVRLLMHDTVLADLWIPPLLVYTLGGMWITERIWAMI